MDSCNSGSLQSSSGADEEYDSRAAADSISAFMNQLQSHPPPPPPLTTTTTNNNNSNNINSPVFDPLSYYLRLQNQSFPLNANMVWPKNTPPPGSDPNSGDIISNFIFTAVDNNPTSIAPPQPQPQPHPPPPAAVSTGNQNQFQNQPTAARNPKKRSRASRRAPTTVLTTDTTNFRAMVQEFTGIPAPPFSSSPFPRSRVDLYGTPSSMRSNPLDSSVQPPFLLRPFAQKLHLPTPFLSSASSSSSSSLFSSVSSTPAINYHLSTESSNLSNIFQLNNNSSVKPRVSSDDQHVKIGGLNEFSLGQLGHHQTHLSGLPNLISSDQMGSLRDDNNGDLPQIGYSGSTSSTFHGEKASTTADNVAVAPRSEGMVESWICSSD